MYTYNYHIIGVLDKVIRMPKIEMLELLGIPYTTYSRWNTQRNMYLMDLIDICNLLCLPISFFIIEDSMEANIIPTKNDIMLRNMFQPIEFGRQYLIKVFDEKREEGVSTAEILRKMKKTRAAYCGWINEERSTIKVQDFINFCNITGTNAGNIVIDTNRPIKPIRKIVINSSSTYEIIIKQKESSIKELKQKITELEDALNREHILNIRLEQENRALKKNMPHGTVPYSE